MKIVNANCLSPFFASGCGAMESLEALFTNVILFMTNSLHDLELYL